MKKQSGNVLFFILIGIFLLGGLTVLLSRTGSQTEDTGSTEMNTVNLSKILDQAAYFQTATQNLLYSGCSENELNFYDSSNNQTVANPNAPANFKCDLFSSSGGGANTYKSGSKWVFSATKCVYGIGQGDNGTCTDSQRDLRALLYLSTKEQCLQINRMVGVSNIGEDPPADDEGATPFAGSFSGTGSYASSTIGEMAKATAAPLQYKKAGCFMDDNGSNAGEYRFYYVLIAR